MRGIVPGGTGAGPGPAGARGRVAMVVRNAVSGDSRVRKSACALAAAGWDVTVIGTSPDELEHRLELDGVPVVLVPVPAVLTGRRRAPVPRRGPERQLVRWWGAWQELARRDAALRGRRPLLRAAAGLVLAGGGWRLLDPWVQEVELALAPVVEALEPDVIHAHDHHTAPLAARSTALLRRRGRDVRWVHDAHELSAATRGPRRGRAARPAAPADGRRDDRRARAHRGRRRHGLRRTGRAAARRPAARPTARWSCSTRRRSASGRPAPSLRERAGVRAGDPLLVYAGGLAPARGVDLAVRALPALAGVHLALVAPDDDPHVAGLRALADGLGVGERLHVVPYVAPDQVVDHLRRRRRRAGAAAAPAQPRDLPRHEVHGVRAGPVAARRQRRARDGGLHPRARVRRGLPRCRRARPALAAAVRTVLDDPRRYRAAYDAAGDVLATLTWEEQAGVLTALYEQVCAHLPQPDPGGVRSSTRGPGNAPLRGREPGPARGAVACWTGHAADGEESRAAGQRSGVHGCSTWPSTSRPRGPAGSTGAGPWPTTSRRRVGTSRS